MINFFLKDHGAISVFISVIMLPVLVFGCLIIDGTRIMGSKSIVTEAGDLAMNAALSQYDTILKDMYGLLGMEELNSSDFEKYFNYTINAANVDGGSGYGGLICLDNQGFTLSGVNHSQVCEPEVMRQQILEYSKYRMPLAFGEDILEKLEIIKEQNKTAQAVKNQMKVSEKFEEVNDICKQLKVELEEHNQYCAQKPSDSEIQSQMVELKNCYKKVSLMIMILSAMTNGQLEGDSIPADTEKKLEAFHNTIKNVEVSSENPEQYFSSMMRVLELSTTIKSDDLKDMVNRAESEEEKERLTKLKSQYETEVRLIETYKEQVQKVAEQNCSYAYNLLVSWSRIAFNAKTTGETALATLEKIQSMLSDPNSELNVAMNNWKSSIVDISNEAQKVELEKQYDMYAELLDTSDLDDMSGCVNDNISYFNKFNTWVNSFEFCSVILVNESKPYATFIEEAGQWYTKGSYTNKILENKATEFLKEKYSCLGYSDIMVGMMYHNLDEHPYFDKLKELFNSSETANAQEKTDQFVEDGEDAQAEANSEVTGLQNADWSGTIPSVWLSQSGSNSPSGDMAGLDGENNKKLSSSSQNSIKASAAFLEGLNSIVEGSIENLYLAEYGIQMFSYYTVDKNRDGTDKKAEEIVSLSGFQFCNDSTALYKSEVEYLLWGNQDAGKNVQNTKMTLFGIRYLLNCIYAFTDHTLCAQADAIAACSTVAAPLVRTALLASVALAETAYDMEWLMNGKSVMIFKTKDTWHVSIKSIVGNNNSDKGSEAYKFSYKEYLRVFLLVNTITDSQENKVLARMADCMQLNLRKNSSSLDMTQSYTMISVNADVTTNTTFMDRIPAFLDMTGSGNKFQIHYKSVLAY